MYYVFLFLSSFITFNVPPILTVDYVLSQFIFLMFCHPFFNTDLILPDPTILAYSLLPILRALIFEYYTQGYF